MKLYRVRNQPSKSGSWANGTRFTTSLNEARKLARSFKSADIYACQIPERITTREWISLLEFDSPGPQEGKTPVDFITSYQLIWTSQKEAA